MCLYLLLLPLFTGIVCSIFLHFNFSLFQHCHIHCMLFSVLLDGVWLSRIKRITYLLTYLQTRKMEDDTETIKGSLGHVSQMDFLGKHISPSSMQWMCSCVHAGSPIWHDVDVDLWSQWRASDTSPADIYYRWDTNMKNRIYDTIRYDKIKRDV